MKISKLHKFAGVLFALALGTTSVYAQNWGNKNRTYVQNNEISSCLDDIEGLTDEQSATITELEEKHQEKMDELRDERRSTVDAIKKDEIRDEMLKAVETHRSEVLKLLTEEQQKEYALLHTDSNHFRNQRTVNQRGNLSNQGRNYASRQGFTNGNRFNNGRNANGAGFQQENNRQHLRGTQMNNRGRRNNSAGFGNGYHSSDS